MGSVPVGARIAVTGATGFIGRHVLRALTEAGYQPIAVVRPSSAVKLSGSSADIREADITDCRAVALAFSGMDAAVHLAGMISTRAKDAIDLTRVNVLGAKNILSSARKMKLRRLLFMSTTSAIGALPEDEPRRALDEAAGFNLENVRVPYVAAKREAHCLALAERASGAPVTVLSPSFVLGPGDAVRNSTELVDLICRHRLPIVPTGGVNPIDVRDIAVAVVSALSHSSPSDHYILAGARNLSLAEFTRQIATVAGVPPPKFGLPNRLAVGAARLAETVLPRGPLTAASARLSRYYWYFNAKRARRELGFASRPMEVTIKDTLAWLATLRGTAGNCRQEHT